MQRSNKSLASGKLHVLQPARSGSTRSRRLAAGRKSPRETETSVHAFMRASVPGMVQGMMPRAGAACPCPYPPEYPPRRLFIESLHIVYVKKLVVQLHTQMTSGGSLDNCRNPECAWSAPRVRSRWRSWILDGSVRSVHTQLHIAPEIFSLAVRHNNGQKWIHATSRLGCRWMHGCRLQHSGG